ncbi:hypothetical protein COR50_03155 [Chitinophaga caeni]|uniref:Rhamnogalacturonase A/B/Epimerase-like pectate lyase domain-containing protein n=1 Tax=Chitinophaga caeni TaxID=2029983 RepID=A0A291QQN1_9BACT|nr:glycosyl hydrolase family 28-related protein [Chitinophaga caeni]ATL46247.1 hypothetical protein COR50_03155 [Chitinophaga caeni]
MMVIISRAVILMFYILGVIRLSAQQYINIKSMGARGDGIHNDAPAILKALNKSNYIYIPKGNYRIDQPIIISGKNNIHIKGDGESSRLFPSNQLKKTTKTVFFSSLSLDQCQNAVIENLCVESKGENWGNSDAGHKFKNPDERAEWIMKNGGHAVTVIRSENVRISNVIARFCGSVSVFYAISGDNISFINCFANAASLGYAGFCVDNFVTIIHDSKRRYYFKNCRVNNENLKFGSRYSAKAGILSEGDRDMIINLNIEGGEFRNCASGGDSKFLGAAIVAVNTNLVCDGVIGEDNYIGLNITNRSEVKQQVNCNIANSKFFNNWVAGIFLASFNSGGDINIDSCTFTQQNYSAWRYTKDLLFRQTAGIIIQGKQSQNLNISKSIFSGGEGYILTSGEPKIKLSASSFDKASTFAFKTNYKKILLNNSTVNLPASLSKTSKYTKINSASALGNIEGKQELLYTPFSDSVDNVPIQVILTALGLSGKNTFLEIQLTKPSNVNNEYKIGSADGKWFNIAHIIKMDNDNKKFRVFILEDQRIHFKKGATLDIQKN